MYCHNCGTTYSANDLFCASCGTSLKSQSPDQPTASKGINSSFKYFILLAIVLTGFLVLALNTATNNPEDVAESFMQKVVKNDLSDSAKLCVNNEDAQFIIGIVKMGLSMTSDRTFTYDIISVDENEAEIEVYGSSGYFCTMELEKINGKWLISYVE